MACERQVGVMYERQVEEWCLSDGWSGIVGEAGGGVAKER